MQLEIVSPEKTILTGEVNSVHLPGSEGYFQVLNNHAPIVSTLKKGEILIDGVDSDVKSDVLDFSNGRASLEIKSGVVEMKKNKLIILVD
ncbi:MAG: F0F1 ATP synthase subunit epsilon [Cryomorphaceae bacterium]|nr:MAG: F0F1 ATP synthase subunit epsilon [Cryomorphaceae bacterium]|tara:strand:- start:449 stop:718 length:270 start_codon:yes stop_codon:yes gene_type:complete